MKKGRIIPRASDTKDAKQYGMHYISTKNQGFDLIRGLCLVFSVLLAIVLVQSQAQAVTCSNDMTEDYADTDNDGYTDFEECKGLDSASLPATTTVYLTGGYPGQENCTASDSCLDPNNPDVFAIVFTAATSSYLTALGYPGDFDPFVHVSKAKADGGLGTTVHVIEMADLDTAVTDMADTINYRKIVERFDGSRQKAATVSENSTSPLYDSDGDIQAKGRASWGSPNGLDSIVLYTGRMYELILEKCGTKYEPDNEKCSDQSVDPPVTHEDLFRNQIAYTAAHEFGHDVGLTEKNSTKFDGHHRRGGSGTLMQQYNKVATGGGKAHFYLSHEYESEDQSDIRIR